MTQKLKARVFISCGQRSRSVEVEIAHLVSDRLARLGFEPYVASEQHSLRSLRENIFEKLRDAEYFLFIDFPREELVPFGADPPSRRGSLFSHQELGIASYIGIDTLAFQQHGVRALDGLIGHLQLNPVQFEDPNDLPDLVEAAVALKWKSGWQRKLTMRLNPVEYEISDSRTGIVDLLRVLRIENHHQTQVARDCVAHIASIVDLDSSTPIRFETTELKWAGTEQPSVAIMPRSFRELDAFHIAKTDLTSPRFNIHTDSARHCPHVQGPGTWEIVVLQTFPTF